MYSTVESKNFKSSLDTSSATLHQKLNKQVDKKTYKLKIVWLNVILFSLFHISALHGIYFMITGKIFFSTFIWTLLACYCSGTGVTAGVHRLWSHKTYEARWPLRLFLMICQTMSFQNHIYEWARDHRVHHKFCDTDADPHNSTRGFFFCHMGWLMVKKHDDVKVKGKMVNMSDLEADSIVMFQKRYYMILMPVLCFILPSVIPWYFWNENLSYAINVNTFRYILVLHGTWLVNSAAHMWGAKPYDKNITPSENILTAILAYGEGWHNYHHTFPWDYKAAELGNYKFNVTTAFIDACAKFGWAYNLKSVSPEMIQDRIKRTGGGRNSDKLVNE